MAINYTTLLGLAQPVTGTESNVWGDVVNDSITALLDSAIAGTATINLTSGNVTLTDVDGAADQARMAILVLTGTPGVTTNVVAPSRSKTYIVVNQSNASAVLKGSATSGVTIRAGQAATCVWNGSDFEIVASGDVDGPSSATDNAVVRYDGTTGKLVQNSGVTIDDSNNVSGVVQLNATTVDTTNIEVTSLKAKDGTAAGSIADATGVVTLNSSVLTTTDINGGTIDGTTIGGSTAAAGSFTNLAYTGTLTGGTGVINIGSGQVYKDASGNVGIGNVSPSAKLYVQATAGSTSAVFTDATNSTLSIKHESPGNLLTYDTSGLATQRWMLNSGEKMRLTPTGELGVGTTAPSAKVDVYGSVNNSASTLLTVDAATVRIINDSVAGLGTSAKLNFSIAGIGSSVISGYYAAFNGSNDIGTGLIFGTQLNASGGAVERMRITSAGDVGIGTSSPINTFGKSLHLYTDANTGTVASNAYVNIESVNRNSVIELSGSPTGTNRVNFSDTPGSPVAGLACDIANQSLFFTTGGVTERMRLDSSGNLGLGVTPSAWTGSGGFSFEIGRKGNSVFGNSSVVDVIYNANYDSAWKYSNTGFASYYQQSSGQHQWFTAPSGTAGNAITFTQAMTLTAAGDLGVGVASPGTKLQIRQTTDSSAGGISLLSVDGASASVISELNDGSMTFRNTGAERARIDSSGNLMVGTTFSTFKLNATVASGADREIFIAGISGASNGFTVRWKHSTLKTIVNIQNIPTSSAGLSSGDLWNDGGTIKMA